MITLTNNDQLIFKMISPSGDFYTIHWTEGDHYIFNMTDEPGEHTMFINTQEMMYKLVNTFHRDGWMIEDHRY